MARILQDGFECEGRVYGTATIDRITTAKATTTTRLDVCNLVTVGTHDGYSKLYYGYVDARGGYGKKGYRLNINHDQSLGSTSCWLKYDLTKCCNDTSELFCRVWFNPESVYLNNLMSMPFGLASASVDTYTSNSDISKHFLVRFFVTPINDLTYQLNVYVGSTKVYEYKSLDFNQWVKLDVRLKLGDAENGIMQFRINDKLITSYYGNTGTLPPQYMYLGIPVASSSTKAMTFSYDDIAVNDTTGNVNNSWCGNGSIVGIVPTSNGSKTMFEPKGDTQNFENVDELEADGDATFNTSYALNDIDLFKFTIPETYEIPPTEYINAISVTSKAKFVEQPTALGHVVNENGTETVIGQNNLSNDYQSNTSILQEKSSGGKFQVSDIENLEIGYKTLEAIETVEE